jgi:hypothetical protein
MITSAVSYVAKIDSGRHNKHFLRFSAGKKQKKSYQAQEFKMAMAAEFKMTAKKFFSNSNFKNDNSSKKTVLLYFCTNIFF